MSLADFPDPSSTYSFKWASGYHCVHPGHMQNRVSEIISFEGDLAGRDQASPAATSTCLHGSAHGGILSFSTLAEGWKFDSAIRGRRRPEYTTYLMTQLATDGAHAMTIVGYDDTVEFVKMDRPTRGPSSS